METPELSTGDSPSRPNKTLTLEEQIAQQMPNATISERNEAIARFKKSGRWPQEKRSEPGIKVAADGTQYLVGTNGVWKRLTNKKELRRMQRAAAQ